MLIVALMDHAQWARSFIEERLNAVANCQVIPQEELGDIYPDIIVFGDGKEGAHLAYPKSKKVFLTVENLYPDFSKADYVIAYQHINHPRYLRMPNWAMERTPKEFIKPLDFVKRTLSEPRQFCAFLQSNGNPRRTRRRIDFFNQLSRQRFVHSGGGVMNNIGYRVSDIMAFFRNFRFVMCFENCSSDGYTTEKIANAMLSGCIPIYWGNSKVNLDFNPKSFINVSDFANDDDAIRHILEVADNKELQAGYLREPFFANEQPPDLFNKERLDAFFSRVAFEQKPKRLKFCLKSKLFKLKHRLSPYWAV